MTSTNATNFPAVTEGDLGSGPVQTVDGRDLHAFLGNRDHFVTWMRDRIRQYDFAEGVDFVSFSESSEKGGAPKICYALSLDMAKELAMVERNEQGRIVRRYFIECERRAKTAVDPMKALADPAALRTLLLQNVEKVIALEGKVAEMTPQVEALDRIAESHGSFCRSTAAKMLGIPPLTLCRWMRTNGWTFRRPGDKDDLAYQSKINAGYLDHKVNTGPRPDGTEWSSTQVRVMPKGLTVLSKIFPPAAKAA